MSHSDHSLQQGDYCHQPSTRWLLPSTRSPPRWLLPARTGTRQTWRPWRRRRRRPPSSFIPLTRLDNFWLGWTTWSYCNGDYRKSDTIYVEQGWAVVRTFSSHFHRFTFFLIKKESCEYFLLHKLCFLFTSSYVSLHIFSSSCASFHIFFTIAKQFLDGSTIKPFCTFTFLKLSPITT